MERVWVLTASLLLAAPGVVVAQTYDDLFQENRRLRQELAELRAAAGTDSAEFATWDVSSTEDDHDHHHAPDHDHAGGYAWPGDLQSHEHHAEYHPFDYIEWYGHSRHKTEEGYPLMHMLKTEHSFLDQKFQFGFASSNSADGGEVDEQEFEVEYFRILNNRFALIVEMPVISLDPIVDDNVTGVGDLEVGLQMVAFNGAYTVISTALFVSIPTGDADRDLGAGRVGLEPSVLLWHDCGGGTQLHAEAIIEIPVDTPDVENELLYNFAVSHTFWQTADWRWFRFFTPLLEANSVTVLNGDAAGSTVVNLTPGLRWLVCEDDQVGFGWSFPVTGAEQYQSQFLLDYVLHF